MKYICDKPKDLHEYRPDGRKISPDNSILAYYYYRTNNANIDLDITDQLTDNFYDKDLHLRICIVDVLTGKKQELYTYNNIINTACICCVGNLNIQFSNDSKFLIIEGYCFMHTEPYDYVKFIRIYDIQRLDHVLTPKLRYNSTFSTISYTDEIVYYSPVTNSIYYGSISNRRRIKIYELRLSDKLIMPRLIYNYKHPINTDCKLDHKEHSYEDYTCFIHTAKLLCNGTYIVLFINQMFIVHSLKTKQDRQIQIPGEYNIYNTITAIFNANELIFGITEIYPEHPNNTTTQDTTNTHLLMYKCKLDDTTIQTQELYNFINTCKAYYNIYIKIMHNDVLTMYIPFINSHHYTQISLTDGKILAHKIINNKTPQLIDNTSNDPFTNRVETLDGKYFIDSRTFNELLTINQNI